MLEGGLARPSLELLPYRDVTVGDIRVTGNCRMAAPLRRMPGIAWWNMLSTLLLIILILLLIGALPRWRYSGGWGYYPSGGVGLLLVILLILPLAGYI